MSPLNTPPPAAKKVREGMIAGELPGSQWAFFQLMPLTPAAFTFLLIARNPLETPQCSLKYAWKCNLRVNNSIFNVARWWQTTHFFNGIRGDRPRH